MLKKNKGQATFVIEVNRDMKEVVEQPKLNITTTEQKGGGFTCCVPLCYNNCKVNKGFVFLCYSKRAVLRKKVFA